MVKRHTTTKGLPQLCLEGRFFERFERRKRVGCRRQRGLFGQFQGAPDSITFAFQKDKDLLSPLRKMLDVSK